MAFNVGCEFNWVEKYTEVIWRGCDVTNANLQINEQSNKRNVVCRATCWPEPEIDSSNQTQLQSFNIVKTLNAIIEYIEYILYIKSWFNSYIILRMANIQNALATT